MDAASKAAETEQVQHTGGGNRRGTKASFGTIRERGPKRFQARYTAGPEGARKIYTARSPGGSPTFQTRRDAEAALAAVRTAIEKGTWVDPDLVPEPAMLPQTLRTYADEWLATRDLAVRSREHYRYLLDKHILPTFGDLPMEAISPAAVRTWHARPSAKPTVRSHGYGLLRSILATAAGDRIIPSNPCQIKGAGVSKTTKKVRPLTVDELGALVAALPERYRMLAQLATWCSLRFGELAGLQRADIDLAKGVIHIRRGVVRTKEGLLEKAPKTEAGLRTVTIPSHITADLKAHLRDHAERGATGWVFPGRGGGPLAASALQRVFGPAAEKAGRPDATPHVLRHTGQTYSAQQGANLRELMARAGQVSPGAALRYLHEVDGRQREIADRLAAFAESTSNVTPITTAKPRKVRKGPAVR